jgi:hypothetical protein
MTLAKRTLSSRSAFIFAWIMSGNTVVDAYPSPFQASGGILRFR